jgi:hypothetical protein
MENSGTPTQGYLGKLQANEMSQNFLYNNNNKEIKRNWTTLTPVNPMVLFVLLLTAETESTYKYYEH